MSFIMQVRLSYCLLARTGQHTARILECARVLAHSAHLLHCAADRLAQTARAAHDQAPLYTTCE